MGLLILIDLLHGYRNRLIWERPMMQASTASGQERPKRNTRGGKSKKKKKKKEKEKKS